MIDTKGTAIMPEDKIAEAVVKVFDLSPDGINDALDLRRPIYAKTSAYGHFGRNEPEFTWEKVDRVDALLKAAGVKPAVKSKAKAKARNGAKASA
jgi:S-adenosylmethionine synthetase